MTEEEIANAASEQNPKDSVFRHFDHWWNIAIISQGGTGTLFELCKAAFECGVETGEARAKVRASLPQNADQNV